LPYGEVPVVFFIARSARVAPETIINLRLRGWKWIDIVQLFGLSPEIFYVPVKIKVGGPPYGKAYGYYKNKPRKEWKTIVLSDYDVINLVNLKFISGHYGYPPEEVIKMRSEGKNFVLINDEVKKGKKENRFKENGKSENGKSKERGKGKVEKSKGKGKNK
jgi:hypothetical protein